ncbi:class I SAM-dependent methyltransferase [Thermophilibacter provencensis]|uniref:Ribosomal RNA small subunit methyltransferase J n=1 Tax=Thermophilibacter provencensis TaxID=1852386 RepID=A0ABT7V4B8_9ACTN|nr:class I SAM-dependent methyltransferase [Thermophilibacter provencensis]MDM8271441.1 class I SAM-dependent methyltransferase [Thermophilibacter provencensis]
MTEATQDGGVELRRDDEGLALVGDGMVLRADFTRLLPRLRPDRLGRELLVRAARVRGVEAPVAVDATAGLGEDSLLLAAAGFSVVMYEKDPVIAALLQDALGRATAVPELAPIVARMELVQGDSIAGLRGLAASGPAPDVVFLDPMFPERTKSAAVKKKFQLLHRLERPCDDEAELLGAALAARPRKVVIKRPPKGPLLAGARPSHQLSGKAVRYDVIVVPPRTR